MLCSIAVDAAIGITQTEKTIKVCRSKKRCAMWCVVLLFSFLLISHFSFCCSSICWYAECHHLSTTTATTSSLHHLPSLSLSLVSRHFSTSLPLPYVLICVVCFFSLSLPICHSHSLVCSPPFHLSLVFNQILKPLFLLHTPCHSLHHHHRPAVLT